MSCKYVLFTALDYQPRKIWPRQMGFLSTLLQRRPNEIGSTTPPLNANEISRGFHHKIG